MDRDLRVTSPMMAGNDVLTVQQRLADLGYQPGPLDGKYGPTVAAAVKAFQSAQGLPDDGIVGVATRSSLKTPKVVPAPAPSPIGLEAVEVAERYVHVKENPPGSNLTEFGAWFGVDGVAWCNIFVSFCFGRAGFVIADGHPGGPAVGIYRGKGCAYVPTTEAWLKTSGFWLGRIEPLRGDIVIYNWDGGAPDHIGIVSKNLGGGEFEAVEGNTAIGDDSNGGEVLIRRRHLVQVEGFGRVRA